MFIYGAMEKPVDKQAYDIAVLGILGLERGPKVLAKFPADPNVDNRPKLVQLGNQWIFEMANNYLTLKTIGARTKAEDKYKVYNYRYSHIFSDPTIWDHLQDLCGKKACHAAELPILFRNNKIYNRIHFTNDEMRFATELHKQLLNFLWTGNPNKGPTQALPWKSYYSGKERMHWEANAFEMIEPPLDDQLFWDDVGYGF